MNESKKYYQHYMCIILSCKIKHELIFNLCFTKVHIVHILCDLWSLTLGGIWRIDCGHQSLILGWCGSVHLSRIQQ